MQFDRIALGRKSKELGFVRDTYEKVCRLVDVLKFMENDLLLADSLALKGGTAINLTVFDLPRLSVDIDLDYSKDVQRDEMPTVLCVDPLEVFSAKTVALLNRTAPRDLYDIYNLRKYGLLGKADETLFRKCVIFYGAIASEKVPQRFEIENIERVSAQKVKTELTPVLRRAEHFDLNEAKSQVNGYLEKVLDPIDEEQPFWIEFAKGEYRPEVLFDDDAILAKIRQHPMALWKCSKNKEK